mmetsp:Transcript_17038/g.51535  ORF Transcript_17038/g.51535 Transcript_17038/m.51535 type:complete len:95 (+) Transcript_17038:134-418(+)|eukprot:scaffold117221_cov29-Tisochrysis_lutea.AAC.3
MDVGWERLFEIRAGGCECSDRPSALTLPWRAGVGCTDGPSDISPSSRESASKERRVARIDRDEAGVHKSSALGTGSVGELHAARVARAEAGVMR